MHKSQGVGRLPRRGARKEYFKVLDGRADHERFVRWRRYDLVACAEIGSDSPEKVKQVIAAFVPADPAASVPKLLELRKALGLN